MSRGEVFIPWRTVATHIVVIAPINISFFEMSYLKVHMHEIL
jgi:hypothetical protein